MKHPTRRTALKALSLLPFGLMACGAPPPDQPIVLDGISDGFEFHVTEPDVSNGHMIFVAVTGDVFHGDPALNRVYPGYHLLQMKVGETHGSKPTRKAAGELIRFIKGNHGLDKVYGVASSRRALLIANLAADYPDMFEAIALIVPVLNVGMPKDGVHHYGGYAVLSEIWGISEAELRADEYYYSPYMRAGLITSRVILFVGALDTLVPSELNAYLFVQGKPDTVLVEYPYYGHDAPFDYERINRFFEEGSHV